MFIALWIGLLSSTIGADAPSSVSWSPDGQWVAYVQEVHPRPRPIEPGWLFWEATGEVAHVVGPGKPTSYRLWATRPETGESVLLDESPDPISSASWRKEGKGLAYIKLTKGSGSVKSWVIVIQESPESHRILRTEAFTESQAQPIAWNSPCWSPDGNLLAVERPGKPGVLVVRADNGHLLKTLDGAVKPSWSPIENRLAYVTGGSPPAIWVVDGILNEPRRLAIHSPEVDVLPGPIWSQDGLTLMTLRRTRMKPTPGGVNRGEATYELLRYRVDGTGIEPPVDLIHDSIAGEGKVRGVWFVVGPDGNDAFYATASTGQTTTQMTWGTGRFNDAKKRFNSFDEAGLIGALAVSPNGDSLALRVGTQGSWSPPAICDPERNTLTLLAPDEGSREEWLARILDILIPLLRERLASSTLVDGTPFERPSVLPVAGEFEGGDGLDSRLKHLAEMGLKVLGPPSRETDETRLALNYLAGNDRAAIPLVDTMLKNAETSRQRLRLLSIRAQILVTRRDFDGAEPLIAYLRKSDLGPTREVEDLPDGQQLSPLKSGRAAWPSFLQEQIETLKKSTREPSPDLVPRELLNLDRPQVPFVPEVVPPAPIPFR